jgi:hypothetical protein
LIEKEEEDNRKLSMKNEGEDERIDIRKKKIILFIHEWAIKATVDNL